MVSESQERMLCVVEPANVTAVLELCAKWEVGGAAIGTVTDTRRMRVLRRRASSSGTCPCRRSSTTARCTTCARQRPARAALRRRRPATLAAERRPARDAARAAALARTSPRAGRSSSSTTRSCSRARCAAPSRPTPRCCALARRERARGRASTATAAASPPTPTAARSRRCWSAPRTSPAWGREPLGTTNNLNFGNPEKPHIAWQLTESVRGLGDACRALEAPIVGGNVSLYNEGRAPARSTRRRSWAWSVACPTPRARGAWGSRARATTIALVGPFAPSLAASELAKLRGEPLPDGLPEVDLGAVRAAQAAVREAVRAGLLSSAHDIAEGGLAVALAECCLAGGVGRRGLELPSRDRRCGAPRGGEERRAAPLSAVGGAGPGSWLRVTLSGGTRCAAWRALGRRRRRPRRARAPSAAGALSRAWSPAGTRAHAALARAGRGAIEALAEARSS